MKINLYADLRQVAGAKTIHLDDTPSGTVRTALETATNARPDLGEKIWKMPGELHEHIHVFVNGRQCQFLPLGLETPLQPGDTLDIFPPVGGGEARDTAQTPAPTGSRRT